MKEIKFPLLKENQIEVRVGQVSQSGCTLLLYKTSRTDAEILDQVIGAGNWQKKFYTLQGVGIGDRERSIVVCSVGIYDDDKKDWVWKDDSGTESEVEQDKGVCSDAFKRASGGSCWGIGRELYYTGRIFVKVPTKQKDNGRGYELVDRYMSFDLKEIKWQENPLKLKTLVITDNKGQVVYSYPKGANVSNNATYGENKGTQKEEDVSRELEIIKNYIKEVGEERFNAWLGRAFNKTSLDQLTTQEIIRCSASVIRANNRQ